MKLQFSFAVFLIAGLLSSCGGGRGGGSTTAESTAIAETSVDQLTELAAVTEVDLSVQDFAAYVAQAPQEWQDIVSPINNARASLGRILFYDTRLSSNNEVSCATCHAQQAAFSDPRNNNTTSQGVNGNTGKNSPQLTNVALHPGGRMFWDERAEHLVDQADDPIQDATEMNETFPALLVELGETVYYEQLFINAFEDTPGNNITQQRLQEAIAEFEKTLLSFNSPFDNNNLSPQAQNGLNEYNANNNECSNCHGRAEAGQSFNMVENSGIAAGGGIGTFPQRIDIGLDQDDVDTTSFKVPSLRNVEVTAPFTHIGQLETLVDVMDFYADAPGTGPINRATTDPRVLNIGLNNQDRQQIIAFLESLTDQSFLTNPLFSDPFND
jgi:cytochrome c peroxidase